MKLDQSVVQSRLALCAAAMAGAAALSARGELAAPYLAFVWLVGLAIVALHRANIRRLREGTENRFQKLF